MVIKMKAKSLIKTYLTNHMKLVAKLTFFMIMNLLFVVACPILVKFFIQEIEAMTFLTDQSMILNAKIYLTIYSCALVLSIIGSLVFQLFRIKTTNELGDALTVELKTNAYNSMIRAELSEVEKYSKDELKSMIVNDSYRIGNEYYGNHLINLIYAFVLSLVSLIITFVISAVIGLVCLVATPILYFTVNALEKSRLKKIEKYNDALKVQDDSLEYSINNYKNIKIRNGLSIEEQKNTDAAKKLQLRYNKQVKSNLFTKNASYTIVYALTLISILVFATYNYCIGEKEVINEIIAITYSSALYIYSLRKTLIIFFDKMNIDESYESINHILEMKQENKSENSPAIDEVYSLKFTNVSYSNELHKNYCLNDISFELKNGETLGILGMMDGNSKTLIADLTTKLIRPTTGSITINNCDLVKINSNDLRNIITYVPQNFCLIDDTVEANIIYPESLDEYKYNEALNKCGIKDILMNLPNRDKEYVRDVHFTDCEKQKIFLANALYKDSKVIVLDNAFSKLDDASKNQIVDEFFKLKNKMMIVATTQIFTAIRCDKILILSQGNVLLYGKTAELLADKKSVLSKMVATAGGR